MSEHPEISIVIPIYREEEVLPELVQRTVTALEALDRTYEVVFVDDGSDDRSLGILREHVSKNPNLRVVKLSRNFRLQHAVSAGLSHARGEIIGLMDGDLQDPPELLGEMLQKLEQGHDVVYMLKRQREDAPLRKAGFKLFYWLFSRFSSTPLPPTAGLFSLMRRKVVKTILSLPERGKFIPGLRTWVGYDQAGLEFERGARTKGQHQTFGSLVRLAMDALYSFTDVPLKLALLLGLGASFFGFLAILIISGLRIFSALAIPGWTSTLVAIFFMGGVQLICVGLLGEYISRIYDEVRGRPQYIVDEVIEHTAEEQRGSRSP
jgi:glycosyltransferase involved in cell wall biosynthesis